ncbi:MAG: PAS domain S-box protein [Acidobacteriia bacterium]|nr:PAS domain S-box protein [Terriglobia bacterium]
MRPRTPAASSACMQKVLEVCAQLPRLGSDAGAVREFAAEAARKILQAPVAGFLRRDGDTYVLGSVSSETRQESGKPALISQARSFAAQAIEKKKLVNFRFTFKTDVETVYCGMAQPLVTTQSVFALLVLRRSAFSAAEISAFHLLGNLARMALENAELAGLTASQQQHLDQLLEISNEIGNPLQLDGFLNKFVVRASESLAYERAFVAVVEGGECRARWASVGGVATPVDVEISTIGMRHMLDSKQPIVIEDIRGTAAGEEKCRHLIAAHKVRQFLGVPLLDAEGRALGVLGLVDRKGHAKITDAEVQRARALGSEVAVALEGAHNLQLSEQHRKRAEALMEMALELGSALRLPEFVNSFTARVANMMQAGCAILALAQGNKLESVGFHGVKPERNLQRRLNAAFSEYAEKFPDLKITGNGLQVMGKDVVEAFGWKNLTIVRLEGAEADLLGILCLGDISRELLPNDLNLLQALIGHASVALENSRLFTRITQSSRQWAEIFDSISDYIVVHDDQCRVLRVNRSLSDFIGVRPAELIGMSMRALISISSDTAQPCPFCRPGTSTDEYLHPVLERSYLVSTSRIHGALNEGLQTVHVLKDITDRREAERRYRELFDNVQEGVFFSSPEGRFIEVNDALVRMLGYQTREEVLKLDIETHVYVSSEQREQIVKRLQEQGGVRNFEVTLRRRDGTLIHALENAFVVRDAQGNVMQYRGVVLDISEVKNFQAQLQRERDFTGKILNNTQTMIMVADTAGLISYANRRCYEAGAFDQQDLVGNRLDRIIPPSHLREFSEAFEASLHGRQIDNLEIAITRGDGSQGKFTVNLSPMRDEAGDPTSVVVLMTDITDAAMIQAKLMHTEKMAAVGQLVSGVAHEVNNPLTAIMGFADLMMENPDLPEGAAKDLKVILEEAQRTKEIVQNLLSFARQSPAQRQQPMRINQVLHKTVALRLYDFSNRGIEVVEKFDESLPEIVADEHQMQQVFLNILNNAYDAVRAAGRTGRIEITTRYSQGWAEIFFRDNGEGIKYPERIFDPFFTTKEVGQGTGLGLSICYGIVHEHDGEITCSNNQEMPGATFCVRLPVKARKERRLVVTAGGRA